MLALDDVDLEVRRGEVLAILGDNGAGKSTLIKCMSGVERLDEGTIEMDGAPIDLHSPGQARALGIETVYQDLALFDNLGAAANFYAGRELAGPGWLPRGFRFLRRGAMATETKALLDRLQVTLPDLDAPVGSDVRRATPGGRRRPGGGLRLEGRDPRRADRRPGPARVAQVLDLVVRLRDQQLAVIVISHALDHVIEVADRAVVMRRGRVVGEEIPTSENRQRIVSLIVGGEG